MTLPRVAVVGAGVSGLAAAWALQRSGRCEAVVLEQAERPGGVLRRGPVPGGPAGLVVDLGAEAILARRPEGLRLVEELGLSGDVEYPVTTRAAVFSRGALHPMPSGTVMGVPGDPAALGGLLDDDEVARAAAEPDGAWAPVDGDVDVASWVGSRVGPAVVDRLVEPLLGGVYAGHAGRLSLRATVPQLWPAAESGASVVRAVAERGAGGTAAGGPVFAGLRGGVARLVEALADRLQVRTRSAVHALEARPDGFRLLVGARPAPEVVDVHGVVLALPAPRAARLLTGVVPAAAEGLAAVRTASMALCTVVLPAGTLGGLADGQPLSGVLVPPVEGRLVKAMTFSSVKWAWVEEAAHGHDVLRMSVGRDGEERDLQRPDDDLLAAALADAAAMLGRELAPSAGLVTRWGGALPQYGVGHVDLVARVRAAVDEQPGLALAGATYDGLGIPACIASADAAVARVLASLT
ncbi:MAG: protoporphyrinogen oxidase [Actinomycetes bacterium]